MIHPLRSVPALVLTAVVGMLALPSSMPTTFDSPRSVPDDQALLPVGTTGGQPGSRAIAFSRAFPVATDGAGRRYRLETEGPAVSLTRWSGADTSPSAPDYSGRRLPSPGVADARPSLVAHGNGRVFYLVREATVLSHPLGLGSGSGFGAGQSVVYASYDGGVTFDSSGYTLKESGRCAGAADRAPLSPYVYVVCRSATRPGTLWAYVSADDGHSFERYVAATSSSSEQSPSWPSVLVGPDGTIWVLHIDGAGGGNILWLLRSRDRGRTWTSENITPQPGRYQSASLALSADGRRFGLGVYFSASDANPWRIYGAVWSPGAVPRLVSLDETHPAEPGPVTSVFEPNGRLDVAWTRRGSGTLMARSN